MRNTYLYGLNSLRFIAAFLVVIYHCNDALRQIDTELFSSMVVLSKGHFAVDYFFILSGFLLTYISLSEIKKNQKLNIRHFFIRRVLRIFPLYYLSVFLGILLIGIIYPIIYKDTFLSFSIGEGLLYYIFFLPNYVIVKWQNIGPMYSLWSIGVEEQFYLLFPLLMWGLTKFRFKVCYLLVLTLLYTIFYLSIDFNFISTSHLAKLFIVKTLKFHFMLFGCFVGAAYFFYGKSKYFDLFNQIATKVFVVVLFTFSVCLLPRHMDEYNFIGAGIFTLVMLSFINYDPKFNIDFKHLAYLGTISYGIYIYHPFVSIAIRFLVSKVVFLHSVIANMPIMFYAVVLFVTIIVSHYSYKYYELYFLNLKKKYTTI